MVRRNYLEGIGKQRKGHGRRWKKFLRSLKTGTLEKKYPPKRRKNKRKQ